MKQSLMLVLALVACVGVGQVAAPPAAQPVQTIEALGSRPWMYEVMRHAYRWYIDEKDVDAVARSGEVVFWIRETKPAVDAEDRSRFGEVVLPQFFLQIRVKLADYEIPELNVKVHTDTFKIVGVVRYEGGEAKPEGYSEIRANYVEMREHLFKTRGQALFPDDALLDRMRAAVKAEITKDYEERKVAPPAGVQTCFLAPLSPVANEAWVFWETGRMLIRFASDIDLADPAMWEHEKLAVRVYQLDRNVVVTHDDAGGSNAFMTRNQAGRALFNCVILGKKVEIVQGVPAGENK